MATGILSRSGNRNRRECESCRVQSRHPNTSFCPNCGHAYGELPVASLRIGHTAFQVAEQRLHG